MLKIIIAGMATVSVYYLGENYGFNYDILTAGIIIYTCGFLHGITTE